MKKRTDQLVARATDLRDEALSRWEDLEDELPIDVDEVAERTRKGVHRAHIGAWQGVYAVGRLLLVVPRAVVYALGLLGDVVDELADRGAEASEYVRDAADTVPPGPRGRRRRVRQRLVWATLGFLGGLAAGWGIASRRAPLVTYESPQTLAAPAGELGTSDELDTAAPSTAEREAAAADAPGGDAATQEEEGAR